MKLIEDEKIDGVSLTGSVRAGSQIGTVAGKHIRKIVLELGGSDPFIILEDADIEKAAEIASKARFINTGQSCIAAKRFIVIESVAQEFQDKFIKHFKALKMGDPLEDTDLGPVAKKRFVQDLQKQLDDAKERGAEIILGPKPPTGSGFFFQPAVVTNVKLDMKVVSEEVFGPIAPIIWAKDEEEIIKIANSTEFGLGAAIWSRNIKRAEKLAKNIEAGVVVINDMVQSNPRLPFGGIKKSGVGRELSYYGIKEFVNIKSISIQE
jgi:succinate-semialdehyde dehydrogenase/glutarate-semialdehyde dehydrogenase